MAPLVWILSRGDTVIATGRNVEARLGSKIPKSDQVAFLEFDVAADKAEIVQKVNEAWTMFGHVDVVVNNAGISLLKSAEEAKRTFSALGIRCVAFECGGFPTMLGQPRDTDANRPEFGLIQPDVEDYVPLLTAFTGLFTVEPVDMVPNDIGILTTRMVDYIKREGLAKDRPWAVRVAMGSDASAGTQQKLDEDQILLHRWEDLSQRYREGSRYNELVGPKMLKFNSILY